MIMVKNRASIQKMEEAGVLLARIFDELSSAVKAGVSTHELDAWIEGRLSESGLVSRTKGYMGYRHVSCISVNEEVVHGVPSKQKLLKDGDLVKVDVCASWRGYCADMARTFCVGEQDYSPEKKKFVAAAQRALDAGIAQVCSGNRVSDISAAIQAVAEKGGYGIVRDFAGHGIGKEMHEEPEILNYGKPGRGPVLRPGMAFAIEPMLTMGKHDVFVDSDGWTVKTSDKSLAVHVEDTVVVTEGEPKLITRCANGV